VGDIDADHYPGFTADRLDELSPPWMVRMFTPTDGNDTAPGLEAKGGAPSFTAEEFQGVWFGCKWQNGALLYQGGPFRTYGEAVREVFSVWAAGLDHDHDHPSPSDDITRKMFDAMDGAS
jgi:hypothetical protein